MQLHVYYLQNTRVRYAITGILSIQHTCILCNYMYFIYKTQVCFMQLHVFHRPTKNTSAEERTDSIYQTKHDADNISKVTTSLARREC